MKMKLLSPAGDFESLKMAVYNGADEVYLGVKDFNARNIEGFSLINLKNALDFAHLYGVRVFLTVNILFLDEEMQSAFDLVVDAYNLGVDAFIVQDIGFANLIHTYYPQIELHASTQMGIHNLEGVQAVEKLGFKRVVLSRETPLSEIKRIRDNSSVEIEYFCQGALCVCFSGNCYMSSYMFDASGNRGKCKQLCRLPFKLCHNGKIEKTGYLLSAKDFNMLSRLKDLEDAGVTSLKIEGRARRPYYVAVATKTYRTAIDDMLKNDKNQNAKIDRLYNDTKTQNAKIDFVHNNDLELGFNRGYTEGYFKGNSNIISNIQNHIGINVGVVQKFCAGKKFNEIFIKSKFNFSPKSTLKFLRKGTEVATISAFDITRHGDVCRITTTSKVNVGDEVRLINDYDKEQKELSYTKKLPIQIKIIAKVGENIVAKCNVNNKTFEFFGEQLSMSKNAPLTEKDVEICFLKSDIFEPIIKCRIENVFLPKSKLNEFRRNIYGNIKNNLIKNNRVNLQKIKLKINNNIKLIENNKNNCKNNNKNSIFSIFFKNKEKNNLIKNNIQFIENINEKLIENIVCFNPENYDENEIKLLKGKVEQQEKIFILNLPNFALKSDIDFLKNLVEKNKISIMVQNTYALNFDTTKYIGSFLNVYNQYSAEYYSLPFMMAESGERNTPYMTMRHCPMKEHKNANCANCPFDKNYEYVLESGKRFRLKRKKLSTCTFYLTD